MKVSKEEKELWVEDWRQSGKSAWVFAKANGLNPQTFVNWTKSHRETKSCFVEVPQMPAPMILPPCQTPEVLIEKGEVKIHIPLVMGHNELRAVMEGLGRAL